MVRKLKRKASSQPDGDSKVAKLDNSTVDWSQTYKSKSGMTAKFRLSSWNVNGIRAWIAKDSWKYILQENPDVLCLQETKCSEEDLPESCKIDGYERYFYEGVKKGYAGTAIYSKVKPLSVLYGINNEDHDSEGRVITAEYDNFYVVNAYVPNSGQGLKRLKYRTEEWDPAFTKFLKDLEHKKPVLCCGDLNVAHEEIDLANPKSNRNKTPGFHDDERKGFTELLKSTSLIDSFRHFYKDKAQAYSFWSYRNNARANNTGWRLDYWLVSPKLIDSVGDNVIRNTVMGSDHCPITLFIAN